MSDRVRIPDGMKARLDAKATELGIPTEQMLGQHLERLLGGEIQPIVAGAAEVTLDVAADIILKHLDPAQAALLLDLCRENGRKPHEYVLSYAHLAHERGETAQMVGEVVMERGDAPAAVMLANHQACAFCEKPFVPARRGQLYCPDPDDGSESCGRKASLATLRADRDARLPRPARAEKGDVDQNRFAPRQVDTRAYRQLVASGRDES